MFEGVINDFISLTIHPLPITPFTLLFMGMVTLSVSWLMLSLKNGTNLFDLITRVVDSLWPVLAAPLVFFCAPK